MDIEAFRGRWAVVTGASSGIGREFASRLAGLGINVVLVARRERRLEELAAALRAAHRIEAMSVALDLASSGAVDALRGRLTEAGVDVAMLVNNAGAGRWGRFEGTAQDAYGKMIRLNVEALVALCHAFLPDLAARTPSAVVNVSSQAALQPVPYLAVYAATKAFVQSFSLALYEEWRARGVYVQTLLPGPTDTEFDQVAGAYASALERRASPADVVRASFAAFAGQEPLATSAPRIWLQRLFAGVAPIRVVVRKVGAMFTPPD
jgi:hypothetical protein